MMPGHTRLTSSFQKFNGCLRIPETVFFFGRLPSAQDQALWQRPDIPVRRLRPNLAALSPILPPRQQSDRQSDLHRSEPFRPREIHGTIFPTPHREVPLDVYCRFGLAALGKRRSPTGLIEHIGHPFPLSGMPNRPVRNALGRFV